MANFPSTSVPQMASGDNIEAHINALTDQTSATQFLSRNYETSTGLTWGYIGGYTHRAGAFTSIANGTVTLTGSTTNYVEYDPYAGTVTNSTSRTANKVLLYTVATSSTAATSWTDYRLPRALGGRVLTIDVAGSSDTTLTGDQFDPHIDTIITTGTITANKNLIIPARPARFILVNNQAGAYTLKVKTASGVGIFCPMNTVQELLVDNTNVWRASDASADLGSNVTQATDKSTAVTIQYSAGTITMNNAALAAGAIVTFTLNNVHLRGKDLVHVHRASAGTAGSYNVWCDSVTDGSCVIGVQNISGGSLSEALVLNYKILTGWSITI